MPSWPHSFRPEPWGHPGDRGHPPMLQLDSGSSFPRRGTCQEWKYVRVRGSLRYETPWGMEIVCSWTEEVLCRSVWSCSAIGSCGTWGHCCKRQGDKWQGSGLYIVFQAMACSDQKFPVFKACLMTEQSSARGIQRRGADAKPGLVLQSCSSLRHVLTEAGVCSQDGKMHQIHSRNEVPASNHLKAGEVVFTWYL